MRVPYGPWTPDLSPFLIQASGLAVARNVLPSPDGYVPFPSLEVVNSSALPFRPKSAIRARLGSGKSEFFAGADDTGTGTARLYRLTDSGWSDVSNALGHQRLGASRWGFAQMSRFVIACQRGSDSQFFEVGRSSTFEPITGSCPRAHHAAVTDNFLFFGDIIDPVEGVYTNGIAWGPIGSPLNWPRHGTDEATQVQSGENRFEGGDGAINGIVAGSQIVAVLQEGAIHRGDYVGNDIVWRFSKLDPNNGLAIKDACVSTPRGVFYISGDGFQIFNYSNSANIGKGRVNDWFFSEYDSTYPDSVTIERDPFATRVFVSFAGRGNVGGIPNRLLVWDWVLDRFAYCEVIHAGVLQAAARNPSLDAPATVDDPAPLGDGQPYGLESFDDRPTGIGQVKMGAFDSSYRLSRFAGVGLEAVLETGDWELEPGFRSFLSGVRPNLASDDLSIQSAGFDAFEKDRTYSFGAKSELQRDGIVPFRIDARYHRLRFNLGRNFTPATAFDIEARRTGRL